MDIIKSIEHEQLKNKIPVLDVGNTVRVHAKVKEGNRERIQVFEGIIIKKQGGGLNETFTVRKISYGVGVEKTFLVHSPMVEKVEVVRVGKARRAKLYYLRDRVGKASKTKEKLGARIENKEIVLKEELAEEPVVENEVVAEDVKAIETPVTETVEKVTEEVKEEKIEEVATPVEEAPAAEEVKEEVKAEEAKAEAKKEKVETDVKEDSEEPKAE